VKKLQISEIQIPSHEAVYRVEDAEVGLVGFIALHSTALGPAAGGLRMQPYPDEGSALTDVLRLSKGMSYKNAAADLPLGGGKAVIIGDPDLPTKSEKLTRFGLAIQSLAGAYWTAEDMGMTPTDMTTLSAVTDFVAGLPDGVFASGDPSPVTARGIFNGIQTTLRHKTGAASVSGRHIAVQGLGNVGWHLSSLLHNAGASLTVSMRAVVLMVQIRLSGFAAREQKRKAEETSEETPRKPP
jgi:leucine dehydrogenase